MKKTLLIAILFIINGGFAQLNYVLQGPEWLSNNTGSSSTAITAIDSKANASSTKFYHLGRKSNGSNYDMVLGCVNSTGGTDWEISYDGGGDDNPVSLAIDNSGNLYCFLNSSVGGIMKGRVIKYNSLGAIQWNNTYGGIAGLTITHGIASSTGVLYFTGYYPQTSTQDNITTYKLTAAGATTWTQNNNASGFKDAGKHIAVDASGNVYVAGYTHTTTGSATDWRMLKYNTSGTQQFALTANYSSADTATVIAFDAANNVYFGGVGSTTSNHFVYYRKYNAAGSLVHASTSLGGTNVNTQIQLITDASNNLYLAFANGNLADNSINVIKRSSSNTTVWTASPTGLSSSGFGAGFFNLPKSLLIDADSSKLYLGIQGGAKFNGTNAIYNNGFRITRMDLATGTFDSQMDEVSYSSFTNSVSTTSNVTGMFFTDNKQGIVIAGGQVDPSLSVKKFKTIKYKTYAESLNCIAHLPSYLSSVNQSAVYSCGNDPHQISVPDSIQLQPSGIYSGFTYFWVAYTSPSMTVASYLANPSAYETNTQYITDRTNPYSFFHVPSGVNPKYRLFITSPGGNHFLSSVVTINTTFTPPSSFNLVADGPTSFCPGDSVALSWSALGTSYNFSSLNNLANATQTNFSGSYVSGTDFVNATYYTSGLIYANTDKTIPVSNNEYSGYNYLSSFPGCIYVSDTISVIAQGLSLNLGADQQVCAGQPISLNAGNGYTSYAWNTGATTQSISPTTSGIYGVTVSNGSGCTAYDEVNITILTVPTVSAGANQSICSGASATLSASGASSYVWDNGLGSGASQLVSPATTTTYNVIGTAANGCQNSGVITITVNSLPNVQSSIQSYVPPCPGNIITLNASGAQTYTWQPMNVSGSSLNYTYGNVNESITLTGTDANGCTNQISIPMTVSYIDAMVQTTNASCGSANGLAQLVVNASSNTVTNYNWGAVAPSNNTSNASSIPSGSYVLEVTNADACTFQFPYTIGSTGGPNITVNPSTINCPENTNGNLTANVSGGTAPYTYLWSNGQTTISTTGLGLGNHSVTVIDQNGCQNIQQGTITSVNASPNVQISGSTQICSGANLNLTASGAASYIWNGSVTGANLNFQPIISGNVTVVGTDVNGCTASANQSYNLLSLPTISVSPNTAVCEGNSTNLTATGAQTYSWTPSSQTGSSISVTPITTTTYTVTGTDVNGCQNSGQVVITVHSNPILGTQTTPASCGSSNGTAQVTISAGQAPYTYLWVNNATTASIANLVAGSYSVTVTDANGCASQAAAVVSNSGGPLVQLQSNNLNCQADANGQITANVSGGTAPYTYLWSTGETTATIQNLIPGNYSVAVTDNQGCVSNESVILFYNFENPMLDLGTDTTVCDGTTYLLEATPGMSSYLWSTGEITTSISVSQSGEYVLTITDENGCTAIDSTNIQFTECLGIEEKELRLWIAFPNPASHDVNLSFSTVQSTILVRVLDITGKEVYKDEFDNEQHVSLFLEQPNGVYFIEVTADQGIGSSRLIIQH